jgi:hypothetical protein
MEDECKTLARQMDVLLAQNQELLARALNDKDQFHAEQTQFQVQINERGKSKFPGETDSPPKA